jgi:putative colanic acid biosynthesis acetyltransferase WcaF
LYGVGSQRSILVSQLRNGSIRLEVVYLYTRQLTPGGRDSDKREAMKSAYTVATFSISNRLRRALWHALWSCILRPSPRSFFGWRAFWFRAFGARLGHCCHIYPAARVWAPWLLEMDDGACLGEGAEVYNPAGVTLGRYAIVSQGAYLCGASHDVHDPDFAFIAKKIELGSYSWVCARAIVLPGIVMEEGAVLAAGAVATRHALAWTIHAGNPAREIGRRRARPEHPAV